MAVHHNRGYGGISPHHLFKGFRHKKTQNIYKIIAILLSAPLGAGLAHGGQQLSGMRIYQEKTGSD
ncbi:MAG: hypothetical protein CVV32_12780 [Methanomicrobiales archaeon HGW-Methanomicrobiales-3]|nr:MAG: hypothetical protein CVV32_12780 [Methanomicrobiales archaeon HGW-Methanomicrobiales-3]